MPLGPFIGTFILLIKDQKGQSYTLSYSIDETLLNNWVTEIEQSMDINPIDAEIKIRNGQVSITNDIKGLRINTVGPSSVTFTVYSTTDSKEANTDFRLSSEIVSNDTEKIKSVTYLEKLSNRTVVERKVISNDTYKQH